MHVLINVKSLNNISKWQMGFNSAFKGLRDKIYGSIPIVISSIRVPDTWRLVSVLHRCAPDSCPYRKTALTDAIFCSDALLGWISC
jgi:hypothetical protein